MSQYSLMVRPRSVAGDLTVIVGWNPDCAAFFARVVMNEDGRVVALVDRADVVTAAEALAAARPWAVPAGLQRNLSYDANSDRTQVVCLA